MKIIFLVQLVQELLLLFENPFFFNFNFNKNKNKNKNKNNNNNNNNSNNSNSNSNSNTNTNSNNNNSNSNNNNKKLNLFWGPPSNPLRAEWQLHLTMPHPDRSRHLQQGGGPSAMPRDQCDAYGHDEISHRIIFHYCI